MKKEKVYFKSVKQIHIRVTWTVFVMRTIKFKQSLQLFDLFNSRIRDLYKSSFDGDY